MIIYISNLVNTSWEQGIQLTREFLKYHLIIHISSQKQLECEYLNFSILEKMTVARPSTLSFRGR